MLFYCFQFILYFTQFANKFMIMMVMVGQNLSLCMRVRAYVLDSVQCSASAVGRRGAVSDGSAAVGSVSSSLALGT